MSLRSAEVRSYVLRFRRSGDTQGVAGNERADRLAVEAHRMPCVYDYCKFPRWYIKSESRKEMMEAWQSSWDNSSKGRELYALVQFTSGFIGMFPVNLHSCCRVMDPSRPTSVG